MVYSQFLVILSLLVSETYKIGGLVRAIGVECDRGREPKISHRRLAVGDPQIFRHTAAVGSRMPFNETTAGPDGRADWRSSAALAESKRS